MSGASSERPPSELQLYRRVLVFNYFELWEKTESGASSDFIAGLQELPSIFQDANEYIAAFEPLMLAEMAVQMLRGLEETELVAPERCLTGPVTEDGDFTIVQFLLEQPTARNFKNNDLVLLTSKDPHSDTSAAALNVLGMIEGNINEISLKIRFYLDGNAVAGEDEKTRLQKVADSLAAGAGWWLTRVTLMSSAIREWNALYSVDTIPFKDAIFKATARRTSAPPHVLPQALEEAIVKTYNKSQLQALCGGLNGQQMVLIQGPPGTGKTTTLLGLVSAILYSKPKGSLGLAKPRQLPPTSCKENLQIGMRQLLAPDPRGAVMPWDRGSYDDDFGMSKPVQIYRVGQQSKPTAHVLICAPSNSALDEIVLRLTKGIVDRRGGIFNPSIVRVGFTPHHSIMAVSLDVLVKKQLEKLPAAKAFQERDRVRRSIIESAHIVASTLSFSGSHIMRSLEKPFDVVIIDEAAQAVEPSILIPLTGGAKQVYLIGDPIQLPATVMSAEAKKCGYDRSMFNRLQRSGYPVHMLDTQYRMHPSISAFPSAAFYGGSLKDGPGVRDSTHRQWHRCKVFGPLAFFDVRGQELQPPNSSSLENVLEAQLVLSLYTALVKEYSELKDRPSFGIISPYLAQVKLLRKTFQAALGGERAKTIDINTIDGFQGREKEIVLFSAVRTIRDASIGFVADERRINVGLTRARCSLLIVGDAGTLKTSRQWAELLSQARLSGCMYRPEVPHKEWLAKALAGNKQPVKPTSADIRGAGQLMNAPIDEEEGRFPLNAAISARHSPPGPSEKPEKPIDRPVKKTRVETASQLHVGELTPDLESLPRF